MGVKKFSEAFARAFVPIKSLNDVLQGKWVILDMHLFLYKNIKAIGPMTLTDAGGVPTAGINNLLNLIPKLRKAGASRITAVYDNPAGGNPLKKRENESRHAARMEYKAQAEDEEVGPLRDQLETRAWSIDDAVISDSQHLLMLLGVETHIAPLGFEAEHYAAHLTTLGRDAVVLSDDSDTVMFGAKVTLFPRTTRVGKTVCKYSAVSLEYLLQEYKITLDEFRRICVSLGCDFAEKTPKVGPVTAFTTGKNTPPTDEQKAALDSICAEPSGAVVIKAGTLDVTLALAWLSEAKGFNYARSAKILGVKPPSLPSPA